jgi:hypothetical protein
MTEAKKKILAENGYRMTDSAEKAAVWRDPSGRAAMMRGPVGRKMRRSYVR